ncbi:gliding motility-associated C-terminal domain-containing protein [Chitinophaga sp. YR573]|uniref:T9SS type B sorting domain-containing protein n=1 Tax=Chitinophaga sp. YR573 TaxID=1881040 RepID=UPI0008C9B3A5|nr:gliding motility-associated C-terminal domain-containing protein [Chitinophaga sp. YR573]SEW44547.1 gliding motility-associated C-terminal domain-containing protein [Chitinophaga sp. YR573]
MLPSRRKTYMKHSPWRCSLYLNICFITISIHADAQKVIDATVRNTCKGSNTGAITLNVTGQQAPYSYNWIPANYTGAAISNLPSGIYKVTVTDANGDTISKQMNIREYEMTGYAFVSFQDCQTTINLTVSDGVEPYQFSIDNGNSFQASAVFNNQKNGLYYAVIKDNTDCTLHLEHFATFSPDALKITSVRTKDVSCSDLTNGQIIVAVQGGTPPYTYSIPGYVSQQDSVLDHLDGGHYLYRVTDRWNCEAEGETDIIKEWRDCAVFMPNAFSPNGDGLNDIFRARVQDDITDFRMSIYGRWGELVYQSSNTDKGWDGKLKGVSVTGGSYVWVVTYTDNKQQAIKQQGTLLLMR